MTTLISIRTRLDAGIYRSQGGGEERTHQTWTVGPLNLLRAARALAEHRRSMTRGYGNIGCGRSWLQIGEQAIADHDLPETLGDARAVISSVLAGRYASELAASDEAVAEAIDRLFGHQRAGC